MKVRELGHVVLYVRDLEISRRFYGEVLGWEEVGRLGTKGVAFSCGRTHHELLLLEVGSDAKPVPAGRRLGLYHIGLKVGDSDDDLREALVHLKAENVRIVGQADHTVTHSLYILDPDGNEIELYVDVEPERWRDDPQAILAPTKPLAL